MEVSKGFGSEGTKAQSTETTKGGQKVPRLEKEKETPLDRWWEREKDNPKATPKAGYLGKPLDSPKAP